MGKTNFPIRINGARSLKLFKKSLRITLILIFFKGRWSIPKAGGFIDLTLLITSCGYVITAW